ncbi:MAG: hypothetical protein PHW08_13165 [Kiritimatiellae bacterium]|nr:hypothetical protein [Kiritimatiellia bacterium]
MINSPICDSGATYPDVAYTYDRIGRQLSAIAAGVSTNLYAYSRYGQLTNEVAQNLCASAPLRETISRATDALGRSTGFSLSPLPLGEGQGEGAAPYSVTYTYDNYGRFQFQTS